MEKDTHLGKSIITWDSDTSCAANVTKKRKREDYFTRTDRKERKMGENIAKAVMWVSVAAAVVATVYWTKSAWPLWAFMIPLLAM